MKTGEFRQLLADVRYVLTPIWWYRWRRRAWERKSAARVAAGLRLLGRLGDP